VLLLMLIALLVGLLILLRRRSAPRVPGARQHVLGLSLEQSLRTPFHFIYGFKFLLMRPAYSIERPSVKTGIAGELTGAVHVVVNYWYPSFRQLLVL
jgi:hypothetical protein